MLQPIKPATLLFAVLLLLLLGSCKKDKAGSEPSYGISVDIDGTKTTFNEMAEAHLRNEQGLHRLDIMGYKNGPPDFTTSLKLSVVNIDNVGEGTCVENYRVFHL